MKKAMLLCMAVILAVGCLVGCGQTSYDVDPLNLQKTLGGTINNPETDGWILQKNTSDRSLYAKKAENIAPNLETIVYMYLGENGTCSQVTYILAPTEGHEKDSFSREIIGIVKELGERNGEPDMILVDNQGILSSLQKFFDMDFENLRKESETLTNYDSVNMSVKWDNHGEIDVDIRYYEGGLNEIEIAYRAEITG